MHSTLYTIKKYVVFSAREIAHMAITTLFIAFFLAFGQGNVVKFSEQVFFQQLLTGFFVFFLLLSIVVLLQKTLGAYFGYEIEYMYSWLGLAIGFFITVMSSGLLPFFLLGGLQYKIVKAQRLGKFNSGFTHSNLFLVVSLATLVPLMGSVVFGSLYLSTGVDLFRHFTLGCLLFSFYSLLPIPQLASVQKWGVKGVTEIRVVDKLRGGTYGYDLFFFQRSAYVMLVLFTLVFIGLVLLFQTFSFVLTIVFSIILWILYGILVNYFHK